jgi:predicted nucleotidyltransferase
MLMHGDWIELVKLFEEKKVRFLVIGGMAVNFHGYERVTKDLDLWVARDRRNARAVYASLKEWGAGLTGITAKDFEEDNFFIFGREPWRIDILISPPGLDFEQAWPNRIEHRYQGGAPFYFVSTQDLLILKKASGRTIDRIDAKAIARIMKKTPPKNEEAGALPAKKFTRVNPAKKKR